MAVDIEESNKDYSSEIEKVENFLKEKNGYIPTPNIAEEIGSNGFTWAYWRNQLLPGILKHLKKESKVDYEEREEGGEATHYWRIEE